MTLPVTDTVKAGLEAFIRSIFGPRMDYLAAWPGKVVAQNGDGTLDIVLDDARWAPFQHVPIAYGVPGVAVQVQPSARALLEFGAGDPSKPRCTIWDSASVSSMTVTATTVTVNATTVNVGSSGAAVNLAGGGAAVARVGDSVVGTAGPYPVVAQISSGSLSVKSS